MFMVRDVMANPVLTIEPEKSVKQAAEYMKEQCFGGLPVVEGNKLVGIITSRDVRINHPNRIVADSMTKDVIFCVPLDNTFYAAELMVKHKVERLPVVEKGQLVGIVTKGQILKYTSQLFDPLTGLYNSSYLYAIASNIFKEHHEITVILFDVNNFGEFNKRWGHVYGDRCLREIARILRESTKDGCDYLCRYGGDEFVVITLKNISDAEILANKVIEKIFTETPLTGVPVTVSAGICGGNRKFVRNTENHYKVVARLINKASMASTKAKTLNYKYVVE